MNKSLPIAALFSIVLSGAYAAPVSAGPIIGNSSGTPVYGSDPLFAYTFTSIDGSVSVSGLLDAYSLGGGTYSASTGTVDILLAGASGLTAPTGTLYANPTPATYVTSPSGYFYYDDQLLPGSNPLITNPGLLFYVGGTELNIFSNGPGPNTYQFYTNTGYNVFGNFSIQAVPEPFTVGLGLAAVGLAVKRRRASLA